MKSIAKRTAAQTSGLAYVASCKDNTFKVVYGTISKPFPDRTSAEHARDEINNRIKEQPILA